MLRMKLVILLHGRTSLFFFFFLLLNIHSKSSAFWGKLELSAEQLLNEILLCLEHFLTLNFLVQKLKFAREGKHLLLLVMLTIFSKKPLLT